MDLIHFEEVNEITSLWTSAGVVLKSMKYVSFESIDNIKRKDTCKVAWGVSRPKPKLVPRPVCGHSSCT